MNKLTAIALIAVSRSRGSSPATCRSWARSASSRAASSPSPAACWRDISGGLSLSPPPCLGPVLSALFDHLVHRRLLGRRHRVEVGLRIKHAVDKLSDPNERHL